MTDKYRDALLKLTKKNPKDQYAEGSMSFEGPNLVWLDVANSSKEPFSLSMMIYDLKTKQAEILIGETGLPAGSFLTIFSHKLIIDKTVIVRTSESSVVYFSSKRDDV